MKVLIFRTCSVPINIKNYNVQEIGIAKALIDAGNKCDIIFFTKDRNKKNDVIKYKNKEIKIYWIRGINILHHGIFNYKKILEISEKYDIIQCTDYNQYSTYQMLKKSSKPIIVYHGPYKNNFRWKTNIIDKLFDFLFLKKILNIQPSIICKSKLAKDTLAEKGFINLTIIPVGLDITRFNLQNNDREFCDNNLTLLYIGQINKRRSIPFLLEIEDEIRKKYINSKLIMIGKGKKKYENKIRKIIKKKELNNNVKWIKKLPQEELSNYYKKANVFVLPSKYEIFGMVLLEANYFNLPIISTLNGGSTEIIKSPNEGIIVNNFEVKDWVNAIYKIIVNSKTKKKFAFSWNNQIKKFIEVYNKNIEEVQK